MEKKYSESWESLLRSCNDYLCMASLPALRDHWTRDTTIFRTVPETGNISDGCPTGRPQTDTDSNPNTTVRHTAMQKSIILCCIVASFVTATVACNGCTIKKMLVKPCPGTEKSNVIQVHITSVTLDSNCNLKPQGYVNFTRTIKEINSKWQFQKGILKKSGQSDGCKELEKASQDKESAGFMRTFGMPEKCPIEKGNRKLNKEANLSKYKDKMHMLHGPASGKMDMSHGSIGQSCYTLDAFVDCKSG